MKQVSVSLSLCAGNFSPRRSLSGLLYSLGSAVDYQPGDFAGTTNASEWKNSIGTAPSLTQSTGSAQPTINADGSLTFDGISQFMSMTTTYVQPEVIIGVLNILTYKASSDLWDGATNGSAALIQNSTGQQLLGYAGSYFGTQNFNTGSYAIYVAAYNGASSYLQINNGTPVTGSSGSANAGGLYVATRGGAGGQYTNMNAKEIILLNAIPSAATLDRIVALLNAIYGVF